MIRKFKKGDEEGIALLEKECFSSPWSSEAIGNSAKEGIIFLVYEKEGKILGYIGLQRVLDEGYITNIAVNSQYRRCGIGKELLLAIDEIGKELKLSFISLEVRQSNLSAISLYEKMGYKNEGIRRNFYKSPTENAIIMTKRRTV